MTRSVYLANLEVVLAAVLAAHVKWSLRSLAWQARLSNHLVSDRNTGLVDSVQFQINCIGG